MNHHPLRNGSTCFAFLLLFLATAVESQQPGGRSISEDIVLVYITDDTIDRYGSFPFTRDRYGLFISSLYESYKPKSAYIDVIISEPSKETPQLDQVLIDAVKDKPNLFLCAAISKRKVDHQAYRSSAFSRLRVANSVKSKGGLFPIKPLVSNGAQLSVSSIYPAKDGYYDAMPTVFSIGKHQYLSTPLALAESYMGFEILESNKNGPITLNGKSLVTDSKGGFKVSFSHKFGQFAMHDIIDKRISPKLVNGKIVMLGILYTGGVDYLPTRKQLRMAGTEFTAHATQTLIELAREADSRTSAHSARKGPAKGGGNRGRS